MNNMLNELEDEFYGIRAGSRETEPMTWLVWATIFRKDTNETVGRKHLFSGNIQEALVQLQNDLKPTMRALARPPYEWGAVNVRQILLTYQSMNDELTSAYIKLKKKFVSGNLSEEELNRAHNTVRNTVRLNTLDLVRKIELLTEVEKEHLLVSSEEAYQNILDAQHLADVYARDEIFDYILFPSTSLIELHKQHQSRMAFEETDIEVSTNINSLPDEQS